MSGPSHACCTVPPVVYKGYEKKGDFEDINGRETYVTGPSHATRGILAIHDIFDFRKHNQLLQGADILSTSDANAKYRVFLPDWFDGEFFDKDVFEAQTPEMQKKKKELWDPFIKKNQQQNTAKEIPEYIRKASEKFPEIKSWGIIGFCWGAKVVSLSVSIPRPVFCVAAECHPAGVDARDAVGISVPIAMLASKDENAEAVKKFQESLSVDNHVETFSTEQHGWMAARGELDDERVRKEYERGYKNVIEFFGKHWKD